MVMHKIWTERPVSIKNERQIGTRLALLVCLSFTTIASQMFVSSVASAATVFITGTSRGIGLELTRQYAAKGWKHVHKLNLSTIKFRR